MESVDLVAKLGASVRSVFHGRERVVPARFRIGASALLDELLPALALEPADED